MSVTVDFSVFYYHPDGYNGCDYLRRRKSPQTPSRPKISGSNSSAPASRTKGPEHGDEGGNLSVIESRKNPEANMLSPLNSMLMAIILETVDHQFRKDRVF